ncbi:surface lipoprotein assembly modifier [Nitratireductor sp. GCM10026969]|uniref:surface lipoprotein assembly modifier n=1 Tax=Nitratireductor sp. GCM10026969 TaxID=3252645 RepID=UPI0036077508
MWSAIPGIDDQDGSVSVRTSRFKQAIVGILCRPEYVMDATSRRFSILRVVMVANLWFAIALGLFGHHTAAQAQEPIDIPPQGEPGANASIEARRQALFQRMMADPANLDIAFEYAALSSRAGDLEAAVSTLERMLIFAPGVPRLQLELGILYFRMGSYQLANSYLRAALEAPNVPPAVVAKVEPYLKAIRKRTSVHRFNGTVAAGVRYQSNANGGAQSDIVSLNGLDFRLNDAATADPDANGFLSGHFHYSRQLPSQGDRFEVELSTYGALYDDHDDINTALAELTFGPVVSLDRFGFDETDLGIYGILGGVALRGDTYRTSTGIGVRLDKAFTHDTQGHLRFEYRYDDYHDTTLRPTASHRSGSSMRMFGRVRHHLTNRLFVFASAEGERHDADRAYKSNWEVGATIGGTYLLDPPLGSGTRPWAASLAAGILDRSYDEPDMLIGAQAQHDVETFVRAALTVPFRRTWSLQAVLDYRDVNSNHEIYTFDNVSASLAIMKSF